MNVNTAEKAIKAFLPNPSFLIKKIPTWKLSIKDWDNDEFKTQVGLLFDELNEQYGWVQEKLEYAQEQAYNAYKKNNKDKLREKVAEIIVFEKKIALIEKVCPIVENVQSQHKTLRKEKKCPEELAKDVAVVIYLADIFNIPSFLRVKHQFTFKYGEKYIDKVCGKKHQDVDEEVIALATYSPDSKEVKARAKEVTEACKQRERDEEKAKKEAEKAKKESGKKKSKKSKKSKKDSDDSDDDSDDDSEEEESSEEEKPKKKSKKSKKSKKESSSEEEEEESSEEEKPKKKSKKSKKAETSDSEEEKKEEKKEEEKKEEKKEEEKKKEESSSSDSE